MRHAVSLALVGSLAFAGASAAQTKASPPAPKPAPAPTVVEGTVVGPDGKPLDKALVTARASNASPFGMGEPSQSARTDEKGAFRLVLKSKGLIDVRVEAAGLAARTLERVQPGAAPLRIALVKGGAITGVVKDAGSGAPIPGARVWATESKRGVAAPMWEPGAGEVATKTDARGQFRIEGLAPGAHTIRAAARGFSRAQRNAVPLEGKTELLLFPGASLSGTVRDAEGRPIAGALLRLSEERFRPGGNAGGIETTDAKGHFEFVGLEAGSYNVTAKHKDYAPQLVAGITLEKGGEAQADVTLQAPVRITGRLIGENERPVAGRIQVQETDGRDVTFALAELLRTDAGPDGRFALEGVPPGSLALAVRAPGHTPKRVEVDVRAGEATQDVGEIALEAGLTIRGVVRSKAGPVADAAIRGFARGAMGDGIPETRSEADGGFVLGGLKPGTYEVRVDATGFGELQKPVEAGTDKVDLLLEVAGSITGLVVDESDRPLQGFEATARAAQREGGMRMFIGGPGPAITITPDGRFTLADLAPGSYVVQVTAPERAAGTVSGVKVAAGTTTDVGKIRLGPGGSIRGNVVDTSGAGIAGATVGLGGRAFFTPGSAEAVTDASGAFELRGLDPGRVEIRASHPQYAQATASGIDVDPAKGPAEARIVMSQGGRIEGHALRRDGRGIPNARVVVQSANGGGMGFSLDGMIPVAEDGSFVVEHVAPGRTMVMLMVGGAGRFSSSRTADVEVREGETTPVEFQDREILVTGRVTRSGQPGANLRVSVRSGEMMMMMISIGDSVEAPGAGPQRGTAVTREDGSYELLLDKPGLVYANVATLDGSLTVGSRQVEVPDVETHVLDLNFSGQTVTGLTIDRETEQPLAQAYVSASPRKGTAATAIPPGAGGSARTRADGRFQLELPPGEYVVDAHAEGYASDHVEVSVGSSGASDIRLALSRGVSIKGRVVDAQRRPVGGAFISGTPSDGNDKDGSGFSQTLPDGSFELSNLQAKPYNLIARADGIGFSLRSGVSPGGTEVVLALRPGGSVVLRILGAEGTPVAGATAMVEKVGGSNVSGPFGFNASDAQGSLQLSVPAGNLEIRAFKDKREGRLLVSVPEEGTATGEVRLTAPTPQ